MTVSSVKMGEASFNCVYSKGIGIRLRKNLVRFAGREIAVKKSGIGAVHVSYDRVFHSGDL